MASKVSARGQITIDRAVRRALSIKSGMEAVQLPVDDHLEVYFLPPRHRRSLFRTLPPCERRVGDDWESLEEQAARTIADQA
jgi:hypothetical protein